MAFDIHKNFSISTVATAPSPATSGTSLVLATGEGALFPSTYPYNVVVWPVGVKPLASNSEIVKVTNRSTDTLTIVRQQESTSARTVVIGDQVALSMTAKLLTDIETSVDGKKFYHGIVARSTAAGSNCLPLQITTTTFTLTATAPNPASYYYQGVLIPVTSTKTATLDDGTAGLYYVYFDAATATLLATKNHPGVSATSNVIIASVFWNGTNYGLVQDERHGYNRDHAWHANAHFTIGCRYRSGLTMTHNGGKGAAATFAVDSGEIWDEDIQFTVPASSAYQGTAHTCRTLYQTGATTYAFDSTPATVPFKAGTGNRPVVIAPNYTVTTLADATNRYANFFVYASTDLYCPLYVFAETVSAQVISDSGYTSMNNARAAAWPNLSAMGLSPELKPIYRIIVRADGTVQAISLTLDDYRNVSSLPMASGTPPTSASAISNNATTNAVSTNLQNWMEEIDTFSAGRVTDVIADGVLTVAPSQNAVFDALALKSPLANPTFTTRITTPAIKVTGGTPGAGKVLTSDAAGEGTWETAGAGSGGHTIQSEKIDLTTRTKLNFTGPCVTAEDNSDTSANDVYVGSGELIPITGNKINASTWKNMKPLLQGGGSLYESPTVSTYSLIGNGPYRFGVVDGQGSVHFCPYGHAIVNKVSVSGVVSTYSLIAGIWGHGGVVDLEGNIHFLPGGPGMDGSIVNKVSTSGAVSTYALNPSSIDLYSGACLNPNGNIYLGLNYSTNIGTEISTSGVASTYSFTGSIAGYNHTMCLSPSGYVHVISGYIGNKISSLGSISTYALKAYNYWGSCIDPNGNIHLAPWGGTVGQKISISGEVSTYSLIWSSAVGGYQGCVLGDDGCVHFIPRAAPVGQRVDRYGVVSTYALVYTGIMYIGGYLNTVGEIHMSPSGSIGQKITTHSANNFKAKTINHSFLNHV